MSKGPIWISVAQTGVVVKLSRLSIFGAVLYSKSSVVDCADTAFGLFHLLDSDFTPDEMTNPALKAFSNAALQSPSGTELAVLLDGAAEIFRKQLDTTAAAGASEKLARINLRAKELE